MQRGRRWGVIAAMERRSVLVCVMLASWAAAHFDPRGARPVEHGTRADKCATQKEWPFCTSDDWGRKCPSGCRIQGLMDSNDHALLKRIEVIRSLLDQNKARHRTTDQVSKQTYDSIKEKLVVDSGFNNNYYDLAQRLRQRITDMKIKIDQQMLTLGALKDRVKDQVAQMQRLEVDIDIKLRSCKGSCSKYNEHQVDQDSYVTLDKQVLQLDSQPAFSRQSVGTLHVMKSRPLTDVIVDSRFKSTDAAGVTTAQQQVNVFQEVNTVQLIMEAEGSSTFPATISKVSGTSFSPSTSSSSSSSTSSSSSSTSASSKSITELSGGDLFGTGSFGQPSTSHVTTKTVTCTRSTRRMVVQTPDGPKEQVEEVVEGGPECQVFDPSQTGMSSMFPTLAQGSTTKAVYSSSKGSITGDTKTAFADPFDDLGAFGTDNTEDDVPDFHARSVMGTRVERHADYVGTDCVAAFQHHLNGEKSGLFPIRPGGGGGGAAPLQVYCHQEGLMGGWLLVQQRDGGALHFNRSWTEYRDGFGSVDARGKGELWIGNQNLHLLTARGETLLRVEVEDWEGGVASAEYVVRVGAERDGFPLHVSGYIGDAGDALTAHSGMKFSTFDRDADAWSQSCAAASGGGGGWWYNSCKTANLNGVYHPKTNAPQQVEDGVVWTTFKPAAYSLKGARMFVRPATL